MKSKTQKVKLPTFIFLATPDLHIKQKGLNMIELEVDAIDDDSEEDKRNVSLK